jgi:hypothetical protein
MYDYVKEKENYKIHKDFIYIQLYDSVKEKEKYKIHTDFIYI